MKFPKKWCPLFGPLPKLEEPEIPQAATCRRIINEARQNWGLPVPIPLTLKKKARNRNWPQSSDFVDPPQVELEAARKIWEKAEEIFIIEGTSITQAEWKFYKDAPIPENSLIQAHPKSLLHSVRMVTNDLPEIKDLPTHKTLSILSIRKAWSALQALSTEDYLQNWTKITNQINEAQILLAHADKILSKKEEYERGRVKVKADRCKTNRENAQGSRGPHPLDEPVKKILKQNLMGGLEKSPACNVWYSLQNFLDEEGSSWTRQKITFFDERYNKANSIEFKNFHSYLSKLRKKI